MTCRIALVEIDVPDPGSAAEFWAELLGWSRSGSEGGRVAVRAPATDGRPWDLVFRPEAAPKRQKNRLHLDLASASPEHQASLVARAQRLGARSADIGQGDVELPWAVLADPGGTEFCVLEPRADYRGSGALAALVVDSHDSAALARFWAAVTGWTIAHTSSDYAGLRAPDGRGPWLEFVRDSADRQERNRLRPVLLADEGKCGADQIPPTDPEGNDIILLHPEGTSAGKCHACTRK